MKRTPEEERIFRALAQIETPEADLSAALRRTEEPRRIRPVRPLAAAAVLCAPVSYTHLDVYKRQPLHSCRRGR